MHGLDAEMARQCTPPTLADDLDLHYLNPITCYLLDALSKGQSMGVLGVEPSKGTTVRTLMSATFPAIPDTKNQPTRVLSYKTIAYIQFLGIHCMSYAAPKLYLSEKAKGFSKDFIAYLDGEQDEIDELYRILQQQLVAFYTTIKGIEGASGDQGERRLSGKRKSKVFNMDAPAPVDPPPSADIGAAPPPGEAEAPTPPPANGAATADGGAAADAQPAPAPQAPAGKGSKGVGRR